MVGTALWYDGGTDLRYDGGIDLRYDGGYRPVIDGGTDLRYDGELGPEIVESNVVDVDVIYVDAATRRLDDAEQRQRDARLAGARPPDYTDLQYKHTHRVQTLKLPIST